MAPSLQICFVGLWIGRTLTSMVVRIECVKKEPAFRRDRRARMLVWYKLQRCVKGHVGRQRLQGRAGYICTLFRGIIVAVVPVIVQTN